MTGIIRQIKEIIAWELSFFNKKKILYAVAAARTLFTPHPVFIRSFLFIAP